MNRLLLFGFGYTGERFCRRRLAAGWDVQVVVRSEETRRGVEAAGARPVDLDGAQRAAADCDAILVVAPPTDHGCPGLEALGAGLSKRQRWIGYASSTAVYGDQLGAWTYENSPLNAASATGLRRLNAERAWTQACQKDALPLVIFRLAGIYGPGRSALEREIGRASCRERV